MNYVFFKRIFREYYRIFQNFRETSSFLRIGWVRDVGGGDVGAQNLGDESLDVLVLDQLDVTVRNLLVQDQQSL